MHLIYDKRLLFWIFVAALMLTFATFSALLALFSVDVLDPKWIA